MLLGHNDLLELIERHVAKNRRGSSQALGDAGTKRRDLAALDALPAPGKHYPTREEVMKHLERIRKIMSGSKDQFA